MGYCKNTRLRNPGLNLVEHAENVGVFLHISRGSPLANGPYLHSGTEGPSLSYLIRIKMGVAGGKPGYGFDMTASYVSY